jgi:hypothetical protein
MCQTIPGQLTRLTVSTIVPLSSPWTSFVGRSLIIGYCASYCILFHSAAIIIYSLCSSMIRFYNVQFFFQLFMNSDLILFFFLCSVKSFSSNACFNYFQFRRIVRSLVDYCSIIVQYSDPGRKIYSMYFDAVPSKQRLHSKPINIILQYKICAWFRLSIGCREGLVPH